MKQITSLRKSIEIGLIVISIFLSTLNVNAQTTCDNTNSPSLTGRPVWSQNALVTVNINADQFSEQDLACIQAVFNTYNLQASASQGNFSGVYFSVTRTSTAVATIGTINGNAVALATSDGSNYSYRYQINRPTQLVDRSNDFGVTALGTNPSNLDTAVTEINSQILSTRQ